MHAILVINKPLVLSVQMWLGDSLLVLESSQANDVAPPGVLQTLVHSIMAIQSQLE